MLFRSLSFVCFFGLGFAAVNTNQGSLYKKYEVGDSAILYCNITTDKEILTSCTITWEIWNESTNYGEEITKIQKYHHRVKVISQGISSSMTIHDLMVTDTEEILCTAVCFVDGDLQYIFGNGTTLTVTATAIATVTGQEEKSAPPWLKYLIFSINCLIFSISMVFFIFIVQKRNRSNRKCLQNE